GHESDPDLGIAKLGFRHGKREVAEQRQSGAAGDSSAVYRGDGWLRKFIKRTKQADHGSRVCEILLRRTADQALQVVEVHAGTEGLSRPGQNQDADGRVSHFVESADQ